MAKIGIMVALAVSVGQLAAAQTSAQTPAKPAADQKDDLTSLDVMDLAKMQVTSASKKAESLFGVAAAIYVVTAEDIKRSGASNIPEALRLVPGVQVAQVNATQYAVTARGFNSIYSDKLLVLIDGRSIYNNLWGGVYWEDQATSMDEIDRIEVIRGPGGTLWGANAVNGVINIITKQAKDTKGVYLSAGGATHGTQGDSTIRYGGSTKHGDYRVTAYGLVDEQSLSPTGTDESNERRGGKFSARYDGGSEETGKILLEGDYHRFDNRIGGQTPSQTFPFATPNTGIYPTDGGSFLAKIEKSYKDGSSNSLQATFDKTSKYVFSNLVDRDSTIDVQFQHSFQQIGANSIIAGLGYRTTADDYGNSADTLNPASTTFRVYSLFAQDSVTLSPTTKFIAGSKIEHNDFTAFEFQPSARLSVQPDNTQAYWFAVSRAVRTQSRADNSVVYPYEIIPVPLGGGQYAPGQVVLTGNTSLSPTDLVSFESGYRKTLSSTATLDLSLFQNSYTHLNGTAQGSPIIGLPITIPVNIVDVGSGVVRGFEISTKIQATPKLRFDLGYSFENSSVSTGVIGSAAPDHEIKELGTYQFSDKLSFDQAIYFDGATADGNASYHRFDFQVRYKPSKTTEFTIGGRNLGNGQYTQIGASTLTTGGLVQPALFSTLTFKF